MPKRVFLSYVYEDRAFRDQLIDWAKKGLVGDIEFVCESEDVRQGGEPAVSAHLRPKMAGADAVLVLVGQDSHNHRPVDKEVHFFASAGKPVLGVRIPNTTGRPPLELAGPDLVDFKPAAVKARLEAALKRAK